MRFSIRFVPVIELLVSIAELLPLDPLRYDFDFQLTKEDIE